MSTSTHQIKVKAVDETAGAFGSIKNRAKATGAQIKGIMGGALAAAGAYLGFSAIKGGIDNLGHLSDVAQKTSTSVDELTGTAAALNALGIQNMSIENLAKSFDYMAKTTGRSGMAGFYQTINELGKIEDLALRGQEAMKIFGRSGMEFMPLINAADESVEALQTVVAAMPKVPQAAADAGDAMSDAMGFAANQVKSIWLQGLGAICGYFDNEYAGGVREAALSAGNALEYYTKVAVAKCLTWYRKLQEGLKVIGNTVGSMVGTWIGGGSFMDGINAAADSWTESLKEYREEAEKLDKVEADRTKRFERAFEDRKIAIQKFQKSYDAAAVSVAKRNAKNGIGSEDMSLKTPTVKNELIMGGNEANRVAILGPQLQSETKKQTGLLEQIAKNTKRIDENTDSMSEEEFKELN